MIALTDAGLAHLAIAASAVPPAGRRAWLQRIASQVDASPQTKHYHRRKNGKRRFAVGSNAEAAQAG